MNKKGEKSQFMKERHDFLVPDYFLNFHCKMGDCREACCQGWPVSISMQNYYRLVGVECSGDLRRRLDCSMHMAEHPSKEKYAQFNPRYDGNCALRAQDGKCSLQCELGEDILPDVCRLYPRGIRFDGENYECSMSNSCEATLELLAAHSTPISYKKVSLDMVIPENISVSFEVSSEKKEFRMLLISIMEDRSISIPQRLMKIGAILGIDEPCSVNDGNFEPIDAMCALVEILGAHSHSINDYADTVLEVFCGQSDKVPNYEKLRADFENSFHYHNVFFENMLVNHMFFDIFPYKAEDTLKGFSALCAVYAILRFLSVAWTKKYPTDQALTDVCAAAFRHIEHTDFDKYADSILKSVGCDSIEKLYKIIAL